MSVKLVVILILFGVAIVFIIQNVAIVEISFLFWSIRISRALLMFLLLAIGIITGWFLHSIAIHRTRTE